MRLMPFYIAFFTIFTIGLPAQAIILDEEPAPPAKQDKSEYDRKTGRNADAEPKRKKRSSSPSRKQTQRNSPSDTPSIGHPSFGIDMVKVPSGILIGKYEVTQGQWRAVMGSNPAHFTSCGDSCPVESVALKDVENFISELNSKSGKHFRLPSEDEWLRACQAGSESEYCGSGNIEAVAWYAGNSGDKPHPVGQKQPNAWGVYDMSGNVMEWTGTRRIYRGGSWSHDADLVRTSYHSKSMSANRGYNLGFRLAQDR